MATPSFNNISPAQVSWIRPANFIDKKKAFAGYERAKKDNYAWDFVQFVTGLEKKWYVVEESTQIKNAKATQQYKEQKRVEAQKAVWRKIPISEATISEIRWDLVSDLWEWAKDFLAPSVGALQGLADIWQWVIGKPVEYLTKTMLSAFWYSDESLDSITTQSDISKWFDEKKANIWREVWRLAWSMALTPWWAVWWTLKWLKWIPYMQEVAKRIAIGIWEWLAWNVAYNVASTDTLWSPVNLWVWAAIGGAFRALPIIWNALSPLRDKLASKLQLSWLMTRTKLENLQNILRQWWAEELANWTPEDVAEWMFQRGLEWNKKTIMSKLDDIADASIDMVDRKLSKIQWVHDTGTLDDILSMLQKEYDWAISWEFKSKYKIVEWMMAKKAKEWWLTIKEINEVKRMVYKDLNPFTASWKVKASAEDVAFANREIKNFIEDVAQRSGVTEDWLTIKLLNNEFAMADWLKKAIAQREALDSISWVMNFISHSWWPLAIWGTLWSQVWPFDRKTTMGQLWNIVVWALVGRAATSTAVTTKVAWRLRSIPKDQQAKVLTILKKWVNATDADKNTILPIFSTLDVDVIDNTNLSFSDEIADISNYSVRNSVDNTATQVDNLTPQATQQLDNVASPTADLWSILQNATDEELKANWFTATMIKKLRKNPLTKASTAESATQSIVGKADEVLQTPSAVSKVDDMENISIVEDIAKNAKSYKDFASKIDSDNSLFYRVAKKYWKDVNRWYKEIWSEFGGKVDDALPTAWKMWQTAKSLDKIDDALLAEARKYKSADEFEKRFRDETYNANNVDKKISDKAKEFNKKYVPLLEDWTTKKYKETIQSIIEDTTLDTDSMLEKIKPIKEKLYNYQKSQLRKIREEANKAK